MKPGALPASFLRLLLLFFLCTYALQAFATKAESIANRHSTNILSTAFAGEKIVSLSVINALTGQPIKMLKNGAVLDLSTLPTKTISIKANTFPARIGSVVFTLSGTENHTIVENLAPYALFGGPAKQYTPWAPTPGSYTLTVVPYATEKASGEAGEPLVVNFKVIKSILQTDVTGELKKWHKISLTFKGPSESENATTNPFLNYRLNVTFTKGSRSLVVPGYFAADGNAAETGATAGDKWRVHFTPDEEGLWTYKVSFRVGSNLAVNNAATAGTAIAFDGATGSLLVQPTDKSGTDFRAKGRLRYVGGHYLQFAETGDFFIKGGADSPENFLAYRDFDGTYTSGTVDYTKTYAPHVTDWASGDPTWKGNKGKGIVGALNYLSSKGMNAVYFLTMNVEGDGKDVWPWTSPTERVRYDVSKLDQWEIVFSHMDKLGLLMHVVTQEIENDQLLDGGALGLQRKLYYRELIARFGHHLAINWNLGEENSNSDAERKAYADYIKALDPYKSFINVHTYPNQLDLVFAPLLGYPTLDGASLQISRMANVHAQTLRWVRKSAASGRKWVVNLDEIGPSNTGVLPDSLDFNHDAVRKLALWGNLMAGGGGVEWYFGYGYPNNDRTAQDWRSRDNMWNITRYALEFFQQHLPFNQMASMDSLTSATKDYCLAFPQNAYAIYLPSGKTTALHLGADSSNVYQVKWYNPRAGGSLQDGSIQTLKGAGFQEIGFPPQDSTKDWVCLVTREATVPDPVDSVALRPVATPSELPSVSVFPNPVKNELTIQMSMPAAVPISIYLTDLQGKRVYGFSSPRKQDVYKILNLRTLKSGLYLMRITYGNQVSTHRIIKE